MRMCILPLTFVLTLCGTFGVSLGAQTTAQTPTTAARPQRTEADARALAERHRAERAEQLRRTGRPAELIPSYLKANVLTVPDSLGVDPFYKKYVDAMGIPVLASERVP